MLVMKALIVIDMQKDFFKKEVLNNLKENLCGRINKAVSYARSKGMPVIWVRQEFSPDYSDAPLDVKKHRYNVTIAGTEGCQILDELDINENDSAVIKTRYSAFSRTGLDDLLSKLGVTEIILAGINTHACIRTAAIDAYQRDLEVTVLRDCVASYDTEHHDITLRYLARGMARVITLDEFEEKLDGL